MIIMCDTAGTFVQNIYDLAMVLLNEDIVNYRLIDSDGTRRMSSIILPWS